MNINAFQSAGRALYNEREDLQATFASPDSVEYWAWCHSHGFFENPEIARLAPPLPPEDLRALIGAGTEPHSFLVSGAEIFLAISRLVNLGESKAILDFGCGCGRLLRFLSLYSGQADMAGVDVEPRHIQWACCNLKSGSFAVNDKLPPLPFPPGRFDTVIALSVFSHLPESAHKAWMEEFARVIAPGGRIIITTLGSPAIQASLASREHLAILEISEQTLLQAKDEFSAIGFSFIVQPQHSLADYGIALASEAWIRRSWNRYFETIAYIPGWLGGWQDGYLLQRRSVR